LFLSVRTFADSVSKTKSFKLNQKKGWIRLIFVFFFLEESVWGRAARVAVFYFPKNIFIFGNLCFRRLQKIRLDFLAQLVRAIGC
jgi:hypothetical protein